MLEGTEILEARDLERSDTVVQLDGSDTAIADVCWYDDDYVVEVSFEGVDRVTVYRYHELITIWKR
jgi:hypothetical protein